MPRKKDRSVLSIEFVHNDDDTIDIQMNTPLISSDEDFIRYSNAMGTLIGSITKGMLNEEIINTLQQYKVAYPEANEFIDHVLVVWKGLDIVMMDKPAISPLDFKFVE